MRILILAVVSTLIVSCSSREDVDTFPKTECPRIQLIDTFSQAAIQSITILESSADEKNIKLKVGVSGCDINRPFTFLVSSAMMKSLPPQQNACIKFPEQMCEAYFTTTLCYDRTSIKQETILNIHTANEVVKLRLPAIP